jgi:hypothetical protein
VVVEVEVEAHQDPEVHREVVAQDEAYHHADKER